MTKQQQADVRRLNFVCTFLFGERWQVPLGEALGYNTRTIRGWLEGRTNITEPVWAKLDEIAARKKEHLPEVVTSIRERLRELKAAA